MSTKATTLNSKKSVGALVKDWMSRHPDCRILYHFVCKVWRTVLPDLEQLEKHSSAKLYRRHRCPWPVDHAADRQF